MRTSLLFVVGLALATPAFAQSRIPLYVFTASDASGLTDKATQERQKAVAGIKERLANNTAVQLVDSVDLATVTVEVTAIGQAETTGTQSDTRRGVFGGLQTDTTQKREFFDYATLRSGTYETELKAGVKLFGTSHPGEQLTKKIADWLKMNAATLAKN